jgi:hypothetical protein
MRGHEPLLAMRRRGFRPASVWLVDSPPPTPLLDGTRLDWWAFRDTPPAEIFVEPDDSPARVDLRFLLALTVHVLMPDADRMRAFVEAAKNAGAARVFGASHSYDPRREVATETAFAAWTKEAGWLA